MKRRGIPGFQDDVMPPDLLVRPTEIVEYGSPEMNTFNPNASGTLGNSNVSGNALWDAGFDPFQRSNGDPGSSALTAAQNLTAKLLYDHRYNQADMTHILEREGGSSVTYHEPSSDDQDINVAGVDVSNGVEGLAQLAANLHTPKYQSPPVTAYESRTFLDNFARGMADSGIDRSMHGSFMDVMRRIGMQGMESLATGPSPGSYDRVEYANESGVVVSGDGAESVLRGIMHIKAQQQIGNTPRPAMRWLPAQSNFASVDGQYRTPSIAPRSWPVIGKNRAYGALPMLPQQPKPSGGGVSTPIYSVPLVKPPTATATAPTSTNNMWMSPPYSVPTSPTGTPQTAPAPVYMPSGTPGTASTAAALPTYIPKVLASPGAVTTTTPMWTGQVTPSTGGGPTGAKTDGVTVGPGIIPKPGPVSAGGGGGETPTCPEGYTLGVDSSGQQGCYPISSDWGMEPDLNNGPPSPGTGSEDTCSAVMPDGTIVYVPCNEMPNLQAQGYTNFQVVAGAPAPTNWLKIGGIALGAAAIIGVAVVMSRK